jgi:sulfite exporter TauE/SafE
MRLVPSSLQNALSRLFGGLLRADLPGGRFTFGALNGLLPCGVVYLAALQAAATGGAARAACLMAGFGLGTLPVLGGVGALGGALRGRFTPRTLRFLGGTLLLLTGAVLIGRALLTISAGKPSCCH